MAKQPASRVRVAALILGCVGIALAATSARGSAQALSGPVSSETPADALARNMRTLAVSPKSFEALIGAGRAALALGDTQAAAGFFGRAEEIRSNSPLPHIGMGASVLVEGDATGALSYFARASQLGANAALMGKDRGLAYDLLGRHAEAQDDYRAALFGPEADEARRRLALSLAIIGDKEGALKELTPLAARGDAAGARCRALILALGGDIAGARSFVEAAMPGSWAQIDPFLRRLPALSTTDKAAAVNLGIFPSGSALAGASTGPAVNAPGDRLASVDQLLRAPPAVTQRPAPSITAGITPPRTAPLASAVTAASRVTASSLTASSSHGDRPKIWLQLASGANAGALPAEFRRMKTRHKDILDGISGYVAEGPDRARLLIGPFKTSSDARIFADDLESLNVRAFNWTNPPGLPIRKLTVE